MSRLVPYPLRFEPIYQYRLWGGRRLGDLLTEPLPGNGPIGEAWALSDRDDFQSRVAMDRSKGAPSLKCWRSFHNRAWESWRGDSADFRCC